MKRVKAACLLQTLHFQLSDKLEHASAILAVQEEVAHYKRQLERSCTKFQILDEVTQPDGSILLHIKKQYLNHSCEEYMN